ncbi:MAG: hypothetical protein R8M45_04300 [Ghiorsea sp.]
MKVEDLPWDPDENCVKKKKKKIINQKNFITTFELKVSNKKKIMLATTKNFIEHKKALTMPFNDELYRAFIISSETGKSSEWIEMPEKSKLFEYMCFRPELSTISKMPKLEGWIFVVHGLETH